MKGYWYGVLIAGLCLCFGISGLAYTDTISGSDGPVSLTNTGSRKVGERTIQSVVFDREGTRTLAISFYITNDGPFTFMADDEIDVSTIVVSNGSWLAGTYTSGGFRIRTSSNSSLLMHALDGFGTTTIDLETPLKLREGDTIEFIIPTSAFEGEVDLTFIGTAPIGNKFIVR